MSVRKWRNSTKSPEYNTWRSMRARCLFKHHHAYSNYGGRGINVCSQWVEDFDAFYEDMAPRPPNTTLDRIDNDGDYSPGNCRWVPHSIQHNNRRDNMRLHKDGVEMTASEWARRLGVKPGTIHARIRRTKLPPEKALTSGRLNDWRHGTRTGYEVHRCKCEECRAANAARHRAQRAKRRAK